MMRPASASRSRIDWIDVARGVAILMVILLHAEGTLKNFAGSPPAWVTSMNDLLGQIRMPLFFLCSGLLAHWGLNKSWAVVTRQRLGVLAWVIILWTTIYMALKPWFNASPWAPDPTPIGGLWYIVPYTLLWFLYAILLLSVLMRAVMPLRAPAQLLIVAGSNAVLMAIVQTELLPSIMLLNNLSRYAVFYFAGGFWLAPVFVGLFEGHRRVWALTVLAGTAWVLDLLLELWLPVYAAVPRMLRFLPDAMLGVAGAVWLSRWRPSRTALAWLGSRTLELFLWHPIWLGLGTALLLRFDANAGTALLVLWPLAVAGSVLCERLTRKLRMHWLYSLPKRIAPPGAPTSKPEPRDDGLLSGGKRNALPRVLSRGSID
jgi:fucose 4-O-acetylase-like acetyltransferase